MENINSSFTEKDFQSPDYKQNQYKTQNENKNVYLSYFFNKLQNAYSSYSLSKYSLPSLNNKHNNISSPEINYDNSFLNAEEEKNIKNTERLNLQAETQTNLKEDLKIINYSEYSHIPVNENLLSPNILNDNNLLSNNSIMRHSLLISNYVNFNKDEVLNISVDIETIDCENFDEEKNNETFIVDGDYLSNEKKSNGLDKINVMGVINAIKKIPSGKNNNLLGKSTNGVMHAVNLNKTTNRAKSNINKTAIDTKNKSIQGRNAYTPTPMQNNKVTVTDRKSIIEKKSNKVLTNTGSLNRDRSNNNYNNKVKIVFDKPGFSSPKKKEFGVGIGVGVGSKLISSQSTGGIKKGSTPVKNIKHLLTITPSISDLSKDLEEIFGENLEHFDENLLYNSLEEFDSKLLIKSLIFLTFDQRKIIKNLNIKLETTDKSNKTRMANLKKNIPPIGKMSNFNEKGKNNEMLHSMNITPKTLKSGLTGNAGNSKHVRSISMTSTSKNSGVSLILSSKFEKTSTIFKG